MISIPIAEPNANFSECDASLNVKSLHVIYWIIYHLIQMHSQTNAVMVSIEPSSGQTNQYGWRIAYKCTMRSLRHNLSERFVIITDALKWSTWRHSNMKVSSSSSPNASQLSQLAARCRSPLCCSRKTMQVVIPIIREVKDENKKIRSSHEPRIKSTTPMVLFVKS